MRRHVQPPPRWMYVWVCGVALWGTSVGVTTWLWALADPAMWLFGSPTSTGDYVLDLVVRLCMAWAGGIAFGWWFWWTMERSRRLAPWRKREHEKAVGKAPADELE